MKVRIKKHYYTENLHTHLPLAANDLSELLLCLYEEVMEPMWVSYKGTCEPSNRNDGSVMYFGNFYNVSHAFNICTNDPDVIDALSTAIYNNLHSIAFRMCRQAGCYSLVDAIMAKEFHRERWHKLDEGWLVWEHSLEEHSDRMQKIYSGLKFEGKDNIISKNGKYKFESWVERHLYYYYRFMYFARKAGLKVSKHNLASYKKARRRWLKIKDKRIILNEGTK
jgi:hypothetical protein